MKNSPKMTCTIVIKIKQLLETDKYFNHEIAAIIGCNQGCVSEVKHGKYDYLLNQPPCLAMIG